MDNLQTIVIIVIPRNVAKDSDKEVTTPFWQVSSFSSFGWEEGYTDHLHPTLPLTGCVFQKALERLQYRLADENFPRSDVDHSTVHHQNRWSHVNCETAWLPAYYNAVAGCCRSFVLKESREKKDVKRTRSKRGLHWSSKETNAKESRWE